VVVRQEIPPWPANLRGSGETQEGIIQLLVDEKGAVASAVIVRSIHPVYDQLLLEAARSTWQYKPATKDGTPVRYTKLLRVVVNQH
jgi:TonB family protein